MNMSWAPYRGHDRYGATEAIEQDGLGDLTVIAQISAALAALRGDVDSARSTYARGVDTASEDPYDRTHAG